MMKQFWFVFLGCCFFFAPGCVFTDDTDKLRDDLNTYRDSATSSSSDTTSNLSTDIDSATETAHSSDDSMGTNTSTSTDSNMDVVTPLDTTTGTEIDTSSDTNMAPECTGDTDCIGEWCDTAAKICKTCNQDNACGESCSACDTEHPYCSQDGSTCVQCEHDDHCGMSFPDIPHCDLNNKICHECTTNTHCRPEVDTEDTDVGMQYIYSSDDNPYISPDGICSPDKTCTCWGSRTQGLEGTCNSDADCPQNLGYRCLRDFDDQVNLHKICLRECTAQAPVNPVEGIECALKGTMYVWVPKTTCHAFNMLGEDCSQNTNICSADNSGLISDSYCKSGLCTYNCNSSDNWCKHPLPNCGTQAPFTNLCTQ